MVLRYHNSPTPELTQWAHDEGDAEGTLIVAVARFPSARLLVSENVLMSIGSDTAAAPDPERSGAAVAAAVTPVTDKSREETRPVVVGADDPRSSDCGSGARAMLEAAAGAADTTPPKEMGLPSPILEAAAPAMMTPALEIAAAPPAEELAAAGKEA